jgi:nicotinate dehydrogenase subunit A
MEQRIFLNVNGRQVDPTAADPAMPLLYALRNDLGLHGPRCGCGLSQCGACTVHLDGNAVLKPMRLQFRARGIEGRS